MTTLAVVPSRSMRESVKRRVMSVHDPQNPFRVIREISGAIHVSFAPKTGL